MAHFAQLDNNNQVLQVIVVHNNELLDENGIENESKGQAFCTNLLGGTWLQTSYNASIRKNYAAPGFLYDPTRDAFIPPRPYNSWLLNEDTCNWYCPVEYPNDGDIYAWDEPSLSWVSITQNQP
jgi:hypothetical protein